MEYNKLTLTSPLYPGMLRNLHNPPKQLYYQGALVDILQRPRVAVVGTRRISPYGQQVTHELVTRLVEQGIVIISGLAYGVDAAAHRACLQAGGTTIAVLPSPLQKVAPAGHAGLARTILKQGGALVSEYSVHDEPFKTNFVVRNRIVAGLAQAVVITEAGERSGSLHTAGYAFEQGTPVLVVPGDIHRPGSKGVHALLLRNKASVVTDYTHVLEQIGLHPHATPARYIKGRTPQEQSILDLMLKGITEGEQLLTQSKLDVSLFNQTLTMLEISGKIYPLGLNNWGLS